MTAYIILLYLDKADDTDGQQQAAVIASPPWPSTFDFWNQRGHWVTDCEYIYDPLTVAFCSNEDYRDVFNRISIEMIRSLLKGRELSSNFFLK